MRSRKHRMALPKSSACMCLSPASYPWIALGKCFERVRSVAAERDAAGAVVAEVLRDSTRTGLAGRREDVLEDGLEPLREPLDETAFAGFAFRLIDLWPREARPAAFLGAFALGFAFVAISAATYTVNCGLKSRRPAADDLLFSTRQQLCV